MKQGPPVGRDVPALGEALGLAAGDFRVAAVADSGWAV